MKFFDLIKKVGKKDIAFVYLLKSKKDGSFIECVESLDPPKKPEEKWVITLSSQKGCPVGCHFCDSSYYYSGNLSEDEIYEQLEIILQNHKDDEYLSSKKIKLHLARMGEPSFNDAVLNFLSNLNRNYENINFIPAIATIGPLKRNNWFDNLLSIKDKEFKEGRFQLQFSINSTSEFERDFLMPVKKLSFREISEFGKKWFKEGDRKITLNFALSTKAQFEPEVIMNNFSKEKFLIKITPLNPRKNHFHPKYESLLGYDGEIPFELQKKCEKLKDKGYEVILSIGSAEEIELGSNCGQLAFEESRYFSIKS